MIDHLQILDCTLRDGGLGLEDYAKNSLSCPQFTPSQVQEVIMYLNMSNVDIIEIGSIEISQNDKTGFGIYKDLQTVSKLIPVERADNQMYVALYRGPDTPVEDIPIHKPQFCDGVRVILRYSELQKSLDFCEALSQKGYKVFVQPMLTMRYTDEELKKIINAANRMDAYALYFVDSYGYMQSPDILRLLRYFDDNLKESVRIGFHAHNNMDLAFSNALIFIEQETKRNLIVDSCLLGMGQGAGNLQTELITAYLNEKLNSKYNFDSILEACEIIEKFTTQNIWGYSVTRLLSAICKTAYKYAFALRNQYGLSFVEINRLLRQIPEELRHRYTPENTIKLLDML